MPVGVGFAAGILLIAIFAIWMGNPPATQFNSSNMNVSKVVILEGAGLQNSGRTFEPQVITVQLGVNNTVLWINKDSIPYWIEPNTNDDPNFVAATKDVLITPDHHFQYTFTKEGKFDYHSKPWMLGEVDVLPQSAH